VPDDNLFVWPARGAVQVTLLPGGGCSVKIAFTNRGMVRSIGRGRIVKVREVPTKRIARQCDIVIRHDDDFESSYSVVDLTPHSAGDEARQLRWPEHPVNAGDKLYDIRNGGYLHFQLFRAGKLVDPREYIPIEPDSIVDLPEASTEP
jgi:hypothetical protein